MKNIILNSNFETDSEFLKTNFGPLGQHHELPNATTSYLEHHNVESKKPVPDPILGVEVARCSIGVVRGVVQVVQNWFTGIRIRPESSRLG